MMRGRARGCLHDRLIHDRLLDVHLLNEGARRAGADVAAIRYAALAAGMRPMLLCGLEKAARGITTIQEVCRVVPHGPNE